MVGNGTDALLQMMPFAAVLGIEQVTGAPAQVTDDQDRLVGGMTQTQAVLAPPS